MSKNINPYANQPTILPGVGLRTPTYLKLEGKRIVLASSSPRRLKILRDIGINPEQIPSSFKEDLDHSLFDDDDANNDYRQDDGEGRGSGDVTSKKALKYAAATASEKAIEVYTRLVQENPEHGPDLVIGADTVIQKSERTNTNAVGGVGWSGTIIEKPVSKQDQLSILQDLTNATSSSVIRSDSKVEAVTSVALVFPTLATSPGYSVKTFGLSTRLFFVNHLDGGLDLSAYVEQGQGIDRAGGFSIEGVGSQLIEKIDGDYNTVAGFPATAFMKFIKNLIEEDEDFLHD